MLKKVHPGDPMRIPASTYNLFVDAARNYQRNRMTRGAGHPRPGSTDSGVALFRNDSGADVGRYNVLGIDGVFPTYEENRQEFKHGPALLCSTPSAELHTGKFLITLEPAADGQFARGMVMGICCVQVYLEDLNHTWADVYDGSRYSLKSGPSGAAQILWREDVYGWSLVRFPVRGSAAIEIPPTAQEKMAYMLRDYGGVLHPTWDHQRLFEVD